jgi:hypothetical protein
MALERECAGTTRLGLTVVARSPNDTRTLISVAQMDYELFARSMQAYLGRLDVGDITTAFETTREFGEFRCFLYLPRFYIEIIY